MKIAKRIVLFLLLNFLVIITISTVLSILGVQPYLSQRGLDYQSLMVFCLVWGMGGAFISLGLSRIMAKMMMGVQVVDPDTRDPQLQGLVQKVHHLARSAGLPKMPQVGVYNSPDLNAFATGPTKARALVAVSTGLLQKMSDDEIEGVLGHEIAHIANGDMVTMTLLQGVVNAFVMFMARVAAYAVMNLMRNKDNDSEGFSYLTYHITVFVFEIMFMILGSIVVAGFSRYREFRADSGGARFAGREKMIAALQKLKQNYGRMEEALAHGQRESEQFKAFKISSNRSKFLALFSTHPSLERRIERLELMTSV